MASNLRKFKMGAGNGILMPGMSTADDLQAAGAYDGATVDGGTGDTQDAPQDQQSGEQGPEPIVIQITITPDGKITVGDADGMVQPQPAASLEEALKSAGELAQELSQRAAYKAMKGREQAAQMARPGNENAQAIWDQLAAERPPRGNT